MTLRMTLIALTIVSAVSGCGAGRGADGCTAFRPIRPIQDDIALISEDLVEGILLHNETGMRLCDWVP